MTQVLANNLAASSYLQDFDLSRNRSLHTLEFPASTIDGSSGTTSVLKHVLSTVSPSTCLKICLFHGDYHFHGEKSWYSQLSNAERKREASEHHLRFEVLHEMHKVRGFRLELCASAWGYFGEEPVRMLEEAIAEERAKGGFDEFPCKSLVVYDPQQFHQGLHRSFASY